MPDIAHIELAGVWRKEDRLPDPADVWRQVQAGPPVHRLTFDTSRVTAWDSGLVTFAMKVLEESKARGIETDRAGLPEGAKRLLRLAEAVPERHTGRADERPPWLVRIGARATAAWAEIVAGLAFLGDGILALGALVRGRARFRMIDLVAVIQECGPRALGIVSLAGLTAISRPLLFASLQPELADAKGVSLRLVAVLFLAIVALTTAQCAQIVGVLLVFTLMVGPAATAQRITTRLGRGLALSAGIALAEAWLGLTLAYYTDWPTTFWITALSATAYLAACLPWTAIAPRALTCRSPAARRGLDPEPPRARLP
jgi:hypothetical protein